MHAVVVADIVAIVTVRGRIEGQQPEAGDAKPGQVGQPIRQPDEVPDTIAVRIEEGLDVEAVDDGVLVPEIVITRIRASLMPAVGTFSTSTLSTSTLSTSTSST
jgi:hypothetical protein